jgi:hypothetical protein
MHMPASAWSEEQTLHVAACYSNPFRWRTRRELANDFRRHMMQSANVDLHFIELAYGDRPFEVTDPSLYPNDIQVRAGFEMFHKENLLNIAIGRFPPGWKYGAIIDADFHFTRHDFALETIHQLQMYDWVQMFSSYVDLSGETLGTGHRPIQTNYGFAYNYTRNGYKLPPGYEDGGWKCAPDSGYGYSGKHNPVGATGGAWAFRRSAFNTVGGLLDRCILGHGDWFMAFGLVMEEARDMRFTGYHSHYQDYIFAWQRRAALLKKNIGYVDCHAIHHFHGPKKRRGYSSRDEILVKQGYSPTTDVFPDWQGVLQLTSEKPGLRDAIRAYFLSRSEDMPHVE